MAFTRSLVSFTIPTSFSGNSLSRNVSFITKAVLSEQTQFPKVAAKSTGPIPPAHLIQVVETAASTGAEVRFIFSLRLIQLQCAFTLIMIKHDRVF